MCLWYLDMTLNRTLINMKEIDYEIFPLIISQIIHWLFAYRENLNILMDIDRNLTYAVNFLISYCLIFTNLELLK